MSSNKNVDSPEISSLAGELELHDCPDSMGALNAQRKAQQLAGIVWTPLRDIPHNGGQFDAGTMITGLPYSSVRECDKFIGLDISLETFMTALRNPASVLYTRNLRDPNDPGHNTGNNNCAAYYGVVCSTFAAYVIGLDCRYTTIHWHKAEGMNRVRDQSPYGAKIGDTLCTPPHIEGHVMVVHDIVRTVSGKIKAIEIIESVKPVVKRTRYTPETFMGLLNEKGYVLYRYDGIVDNQYAPSPYVAVDEEQEPGVAYNTILALDCGNKANYRLGESTAIHVMDKGAVELVIQQRNDVDSAWNTRCSIAVSEVTDVMINGVSYPIFTYPLTNMGFYQAHCVMENGEASEAVEWQVSSVSAEVPKSAAVNEGGDVTFASSNNAKPLYISWNNSSGVSYKCQSLTEKEIAAGTAVTSFDQPGTWYVKVYFQTTYGRLASAAKAVVLV
ncbi:MAG: hypothetical protein K0Q59_143 [Paenibacillus sp.]|nr:hypothetical protein [Paenibacillus sp.]